MQSLIKLNTLIHFNNGSTISICCFSVKKEILLEYNIKVDFKALLKNTKSLRFLKTNKDRFSFLYKSKNI